METRIGTKGGFIATAACAAVLTACAMTNQQPQGQAASGTGRQCFLPSQVNGFNAVDSDTVQVTVGVNTIYQLQIAGACPDIDWSQRIGIRSTGGGSWICGGLDAELIVPSPMGVQRCPVTNVRQLSPAGVQASKAKRKT